MDEIPKSQIKQLYDTPSTIVEDNILIGNASNSFINLDTGTDWLTQYHNDTRGDVRYYTKSQVSTILLNYLLIDGTRAMTGALDMGTNLINNVVDPTTNQQAATKKYVDDNAGGTLDHAALTSNLLWLNSLHTGTADKIATFDGSGNADEIDLETGLFLPELKFGGANVGMNVISSLGAYIKIDKYATFSLKILIFGKGTSTGNATVEGIPFIISGDTALAWFLTGITFNTNSVIQTVASNNTTLIKPFQLSNISVFTQLNDTNFNNGVFVSVAMSGTYRTT